METKDEEADLNDRVFFTEGNLPPKSPTAAVASIKKSAKFGPASGVDSRGNTNSLPNFSSLFNSYTIDNKLF